MTKSINNIQRTRTCHYHYNEMEGFRKTNHAEVEEWKSKGVYVFDISLSRQEGETYIHFNRERFRLENCQARWDSSIMEELRHHMNQMDVATALDMCKKLLKGHAIRVSYDYDDGLGYYDYGKDD